MLNTAASSQTEYLFKVVIIGDSCVGKSSIMTRFVDKEFVYNENYICTIGVDFKTQYIMVDDKNIKLQIWDTAGQERFRHITTSYYRGTHGCILVYDITDYQTFQNLKSWIADLERYGPGDENRILLGNKCDAETTRQVSYEEARAFADQYDMPFVESSAKRDVNIYGAFELLARNMYKRLGKEALTNNNPFEGNIKVSGKKNKKETKKTNKGCC